MDQETTGTRSYDGMDVFRSWGPHVKKFALAFEVTQGKAPKHPVDDCENVPTGLLTRCRQTNWRILLSRPSMSKFGPGGDHISGLPTNMPALNSALVSKRKPTSFVA